MVTVHREGPFRVAVYPPPKEHGPPHVHVIRDENEVLINLGDENTAPSLRENRGLGAPDVRRALGIVMEQQEALLAEWRWLHGS